MNEEDPEGGLLLSITNDRRQVSTTPCRVTPTTTNDRRGSEPLEGLLTLLHLPRPVRLPGLLGSRCEEEEEEEVLLTAYNK